MATEKQIAANRANAAAKSTGPGTPDGKRSFSRNGTRHGMLAMRSFSDSSTIRKLTNRYEHGYERQSRLNLEALEKFRDRKAAGARRTQSGVENKGQAETAEPAGTPTEPEI